MTVAGQPAVTVYVALLSEGTNVWRPVQAQEQSDGSFRIVSSNKDPDDEKWQFNAGDRVRCEIRHLAGGHQLVAVSVAS
jgi:hypothetical protein